MLFLQHLHMHVILSSQLEKVYDPKNEEDDMMEMEEERLRMREHVMKNVRSPFCLHIHFNFTFIHSNSTLINFSCNILIAQVYFSSLLL